MSATRPTAEMWALSDTPDPLVGPVDTLPPISRAQKVFATIVGAMLRQPWTIAAYLFFLAVLVWAGWWVCDAIDAGRLAAPLLR